MLWRKLSLVFLYGILASLLVVALVKVGLQAGLRRNPATTHTRVEPKVRVDRSAKDGSNLKQVFLTVDSNEDGLVSHKELAQSISVTVQSHMQNCLKSNMRKFFQLDKITTNGMVEWDEWLQSFRQDYPSLAPRDAKEALSEAKARWSEAARTNPNALNIDEFLSFSHPEFSHPNLLQQVDEMILVLDTNQDQMLDLTEYSQRAPSSKVKKKEFEVLDENRDGQVSKRELFPFLDPKSKLWARRTARNILTQLDVNHDHALSFEELARNDEIPELLLPERIFYAFV
ncbi:hypothetical protein TCAL_08387 [Tigriopus californicus]|uniref:EF-hand domain-containing protein n=1 Tax=Tigriopus californicus TaxID=6832 RepID=A0A553PCX2_TIGCA|nr:45 kDa calcium-binding protein-like [Tigriopus californicus]TRY75529.1 hypothetical protein TCAL_08387 [Tigriopus californicus]|eukprot:TCALIF_08387-PA protein Name:"Similar to sdf4 45 kDa calcium-binding protein (Xenopus laevis)" AED:0.10 eAED:0.10 QI:0/-1/0/1/-1/1/1/0/285